MIEIVYEKEKQKPEGNEGFFHIPNNIRQIGEVNETQKIYIEDYAYTYLCRSLPGILPKEKQQFFWDRPTGKTAFPIFL
ncbi:MAG: hypothetical protein ACLRMZ_19785 [Blautia marasmi]